MGTSPVLGVCFSIFCVANLYKFNVKMNLSFVFSYYVTLRTFSCFFCCYIIVAYTLVCVFDAFGCFPRTCFISFFNFSVYVIYTASLSKVTLSFSLSFFIT